MVETIVGPNGPGSELVVGVRALFRVPERGGASLGFGKVLKINRKSVIVEDEKSGRGKLSVDKAMIYKIINFEG